MRPIELGSRYLRWATVGLFVAAAALGGCFPDPPLVAIADGSELADAETGDGEVVDVLADSEIAEDVVEADTSVAELESVDAQEVDSDAEVDVDAEFDVADGEIEPVVNACGGDGVLTPGEPGTACGPCLDGELVCVASDPDLNTTVCENATTLNVCGGCGKLAHELDGACDECGVYGCDPGGSSEVVCIEPAAGCFTPMLCDDLACESQGRLCIEGDADTDAVCGDCLDDHVAVDDGCLPMQLPPENVTASVDRASDVEVRWDAAADATGYRVFRCDADDCADDADWNELTESPIATTTFIDDAVTVPSAPTAPTTVTASADRTDKVVVTWSPVVAGSAARYAYRVVAEGPAGTSEPSLEANGGAGERAIEAYQVRVDGGAWTTIELAAGLQWEDLAALPATLTAPTVTASQGTYAEYVRLSAVGAKATDGAARQYEVRAVNAHEPGASGSASGKRTAGALALQWERSASTNAANFTAIAGAIAATFDDTGAPADGSVRWYRVSVTAAGAQPVASTSTSGARKAPPGVPGNVSATIDLNDKVTVTWGTVSDAIGYHVYRDGQKLTSGNGVTGTSYDDFGAPAPVTNWDAPTGVVATTNDPTNVTVTWTAPVRPLGAAASYEVLAVNAAGEGPRSAVASGRRAALALVGYDVEVTPAGGGTSWISTSSTDTTWIHSSAPGATVSGGSVSASRGEFSASVHLQIVGATAIATGVTYRVRGVLVGGAFSAISAPTVGSRVAGALSYQWEKSGSVSQSAFTNVAGATAASAVDVGAPVDGEFRWYRVVTSVAGGNSVTSAAVEGWRLIFTAVDGGEAHACALSIDGRIYCWGRNTYGELGRGTTGVAPGVVAIANPGGFAFTSLSVGFRHSCALNTQNELWCWGDNDNGQLGDGSLTDRASPVKVVGLSSAATMVSAGRDHTCAVTQFGTAQCWGTNDKGQLGNNTTNSSAIPVTVRSNTGELGSILGVYASTGRHSCARRAADVYCWGSNDNAQLGNSPWGLQPPEYTTWVVSLVAISVPNIAATSDMGLGLLHTCILGSDAVVRCWGANQFGQLGDGRAVTNSYVNPFSATSSSTRLVVGRDHACARLSNGSVNCWGVNGDGQLGNGSTGTSNVPVQASNVLATELGAGEAFTCAVVSGRIKCWGDNSSGQLGDGSSVDRPTAVDVNIP